jgi:tetratricopeptide (TPR) repeat protein
VPSTSGAPATAKEEINAGSILVARQDFQLAYEAFERGWAIDASAFSQDTADALEMLGKAFHEYHHDDNGATLSLEFAARVRARVLGPNHSAVARTYCDLGDLLQDQNPRQAIQFYALAQGIEEKKGKKHRDWELFDMILNNGGRAHELAGDFPKAVEVYTRCLEGRDLKLGRQNASTAEMLYNLAKVEMNLGRNAQAIKHFGEALAVQKRVLGPQHMHVSMTLNNLGSTYLQAGDKDNALVFLEKALVVKRKTMKKVDLSLAATIQNIALILKEKPGRLAEASRLYKEVYEMKLPVMGPNHPEVLAAKANFELLTQPGAVMVGTNPDCD